MHTPVVNSGRDLRTCWRPTWRHAHWSEGTWIIKRGRSSLCKA